MVIELIFYKIDHNDDDRIYLKEFEDNLFVEEIEKLDDYQNMENVKFFLYKNVFKRFYNSFIFL